jgi:hypothetical protein
MDVRPAAAGDENQTPKRAKRGIERRFAPKTSP